MRIDVSAEDCAGFKGGWSLCAKQVAAALCAVEFESTLRILEFGSGDGTRAMAELLDRLKVPFDYTAYENDQRFTCVDPRIETIPWDGVNFPPKILGQYHLIIVDGPNGKTREQWYPLMRPAVIPGTIILIDDYDHHPEFGTALNANFVYEIVDRQSGQHECWLTAKVVHLKKTVG